MPSYHRSSRNVVGDVDLHGTVVNYASIYEENTLEQAMMISRGFVTEGHVVMLPDAHFGMGACVGTAIQTRGGIYPAAVGVDIGCGMIAVQTTLKGEDLSLDQRRRLRGAIEKEVPSGVGKARLEVPEDFDSFLRRYDWAPSIEDGKLADFQKRPTTKYDLMSTAGEQFGTLGAGNHFVEVSVDEDDAVWAIVHSGSRGIGNRLAMMNIRAAQDQTDGIYDLEHRDLAFLIEGTEEFDRYIADMLWAQHYAFEQREAMMRRVLLALGREHGFETLQKVNCHHNYSEVNDAGIWLSRKGAISATAGTMGVIPGSMGTDTYIVEGLGNDVSYNTAPHGAGRVSSRGRPAKYKDGKMVKKATGAYARFSVEEFSRIMEERGVVWQDRDADNLLDESPMVYKDIEVVLEDAAEIVEKRFKLQQIVNYKGL